MTGGGGRKERGERGKREAIISGDGKNFVGVQLSIFLGGWREEGKPMMMWAGRERKKKFLDGGEKRDQIALPLSFLFLSSFHRFSRDQR